MGASVVLACRDLRRANEAVKTIQRQSGNHSVQAMVQFTEVVCYLLPLNLSMRERVGVSVYV